MMDTLFYISWACIHWYSLFPRNLLISALAFFFERNACWNCFSSGPQDLVFIWVHWKDRSRFRRLHHLHLQWHRPGQHQLHVHGGRKPRDSQGKYTLCFPRMVRDFKGVTEGVKYSSKTFWLHSNCHDLAWFVSKRDCCFTQHWTLSCCSFLKID